MRRARRSSALGFVLVVAVVAGCGSDGAADTTTSSASAPTSSSTSASTTTTRPLPTTYAFPVVPAGAVRYGRTHHDYPATDAFAPCGSAVVAVVPGVISETSEEDVWDPKTDDPALRGGLSVTLVGDDGVRYYGSHLQTVVRSAGDRVAAGDPLGTVGETGNAAGTGCHLHFGISPPCGVGDWRVRRGTISPAPYLDSWRSADPTASPRDEIADWRAAHPADCP